jgi:hypothetical protein
VTVVLLAGVLYYGAAVYTSGFGSYKQPYPLVLFQSLSKDWWPWPSRSRS